MHTVTQAMLQPGDIILSTGNGYVYPQSAAIRVATWSNVSHAALYVGGPEGYVIEAVGEGVRKLAVSAALADETLAIVYTRFGMNASLAAATVIFARAQMGKPYNYAGAIAAGASTPAGTCCKAATVGASAVFAGAGAIAACKSKAWFCSELVAAAYEWVGRPLLQDSPGQITAARIADSPFLACLGRLK